MIGTTLSHYRILEKLGAGGMGEVFLAEDTTLDRRVAIKVLPDVFAGDPERLARFEREAKLLASLNHPNIASIYGLGQADGKRFIVMELAEGETLAKRISRGPRPVDQTLAICRQIAEGLESAHEKGIIHRDLKPSNVMISDDGKVKILDFGLAKVFQTETAAPDVTQSPTISEAATRAGVILGTAAYMSPEQAKGKPVDTRTDIWAFGCVLFECLVGEKAFVGQTITEVVASILKVEPDWNLLPTETPRAVRTLLRRCLQKDPARRLRHIGDASIEIEEALAQPADRTEKVRKTWFVPVLLSAATVLLLVAGLLMGRLTTPPSVPPQYHQLTFAGERLSSARFAPDQRTVVYSSARAGGIASELFSVAPHSVASSSLGLKDTDVAAISPAGEMLVIQQCRQLFGFASVGVLARAPLTGAAPRPILSDVQDADWGPGNQIAVSRFVSGRYRLEYPAGHVLYESSGYVSHVRVSSKGDLVAFADHPVLGDNGGTIAIVDSSGRKRVLSTPQVAIPGLAWAPSGKEVWFSGSAVGVAVSLKSVDLSGHERVVARGPGNMVICDVSSDGHALLIHESGRLVAMALGPGQTQEHDLTVVDFTVVNAISPDGRLALLEEEGTGSSPNYDIYLRPTDGSAPVRLGEGHGYDFSPDMKWVLASVRGQLFLVPVGPGEPQQITHDSIDHAEARFLPGGKGVVFTGVEPGHKPRIYTQTIGAGTPRAISPEGVRGKVPTADGRFVFGFSDVVALYPVDGQGAPRALHGMYPGDHIAAIPADGRSVLVASSAIISLDVFRVDLASSRRELVKKIRPADPAGLFMQPNGSFTPDGKYYAYFFALGLSELYAVDGLR